LWKTVFWTGCLWMIGMALEAFNRFHSYKERLYVEKIYKLLYFSN